MTLAELKAKAYKLGLTHDDVRAYGSLAKKATWEQAIVEFEQWIDNAKTKTGYEYRCFPDIARKHFLKSKETVETVKDEPEPTGKMTESDPIGQTESDLSKDIAVTLNQPTLYECPHCSGDGKFLDDNDETGWKECDFCDGKKFVTAQACEEYQRWEEEGGAVEMNQSTEIACLINHPALAEGELIEPSPGGFFLGKDDRDLPLYSGWVDSDENKLKIFPIYQPIPPITIPEISEKLSEGKYFQNFPKFATPLKDEFLLKMTTYIGDGITAGEFEALKDEPLDEFTAAVYLGWLEESERMVREAVAA